MFSEQWTSFFSDTHIGISALRRREIENETVQKCSFVAASRVSSALKDGKVRRGEAVKPTATAINNFKRECRSFNGINVAPRVVAAAAAATCQHWPRVHRARTHCAARGAVHHLCNVRVSLNNTPSIFHIHWPKITIVVSNISRCGFRIKYYSKHEVIFTILRPDHRNAILLLFSKFHIVPRYTFVNSKKYLNWFFVNILFRYNSIMQQYTLN